ncbi:MAG: hypothetical protein KDK70_05130, partial [Myxococcales bacterium]|nr:hypothetical protein [Myxococcales bacterium]
MFRAPKFSDWRIAGSAGANVMVETPVVNVSAGASYLQLPLENSRTKETMTLHMAGGGVGLGLGVSLLGVVDFEGSLSAFPSDGIGQILEGPRSDGRLTRDDFVGNRVVVLSLGAKFEFGAGIAAASFIKNDFWTRLGTAAIPGPADDVTLWSHA